MKSQVNFNLKRMPADLLDKYAASCDLGPLVYVSYIDVNGEKDYIWIDLCRFESYDNYVAFCDYLCLDETGDLNLSFVDIPEILQVHDMYNQFTFTCVREYFYCDDAEKEIWRLFMEKVSGRPVAYPVAECSYEGLFDSPEDYANELYDIDLTRDGMSREEYQQFVFAERAVFVEGHVFTRLGC